MCSTTGPKFFLPPNQLGSNGPMDMPLAYASNRQATFDAGNLPAPAAASPAPAATAQQPVTPKPIRSIFQGPYGYPGDALRAGGNRSNYRIASY